MEHWFPMTMLRCGMETQDALVFHREAQEVRIPRFGQCLLIFVFLRQPPPIIIEYMGSWFRCPCGSSLHRNLFCGADVHLVVPDSLLDQFQDDSPARPCIDRIVTGCDSLLRCPQCQRIIILHRDGTATSYVPEPL